MAQVIFAFRQTRPIRENLPSRRLLSRLSDALKRWRVERRRVRAEAYLRWKLEGYSDHLLRDMGLTFESGRVRPWQPDSRQWS